jgi:cytochrome c oxidase subunit 3
MTVIDSIHGEPAALAAPGGGGGPVRSLAHYRDRPTRQDLTARVGMVIFLGSWLMLFAGLFFVYGLVRARAPVWPPLDQPRLPLLLPGVNTVAIAASSAALLRALGALRSGAQRVAGRWLALAAGLGCLFLALQLVVWVGLWRAGLLPSGGPYASAFYGLTVLHALHVAVGLLALGLHAARALAGRAARLSVDLWAMYWHAVGAVWLVLYVAVYLS